MFPIATEGRYGLPPVEEQVHLYYIVIYNLQSVRCPALAMLVSIMYPFRSVLDASTRPDGEGYALYLGFEMIDEAYRVGLAMPWWVSATRRWYTYVAASRW